MAAGLAASVSLLLSTMFLLRLRLFISEVKRLKVRPSHRSRRGELTMIQDGPWKGPLLDESSLPPHAILDITCCHISQTNSLSLSDLMHGSLGPH